MKNTNIVKKILSAALSLSLVLSLAACGGSGSGTSSAGGSAASQTQDASSSSSEAVKEYKVGIVKFMDHASLDQIEKNIQKELDAKSAELGVNFNYKVHTANGPGDRQNAQNNPKKIFYFVYFDT